MNEPTYDLADEDVERFDRYAVLLDHTLSADDKDTIYGQILSELTEGKKVSRGFRPQYIRPAVKKLDQFSEPLRTRPLEPPISWHFTVDELYDSSMPGNKSQYGVICSTLDNADMIDSANESQYSGLPLSNETLSRINTAAELYFLYRFDNYVDSVKPDLPEIGEKIRDEAYLSLDGYDAHGLKSPAIKTNQKVFFTAGDGREHELLEQYVDAATEQTSAD